MTYGRYLESYKIRKQIRVAMLNIFEKLNIFKYSV